MKSLVVNETKYGNTENMARAVVEVLGGYGEYWVALVRSIAALSAEEDCARAWAAKSLGRAHRAISS